MALLSILKDNPKYALMRGVARFASVRNSVAAVKSTITRAQRRRRERELDSRMSSTLFPNIRRDAFLAEMKQQGCAFGLQLPAPIVEIVSRYAQSHPVYAFRNEHQGFLSRDRQVAEAALGKEILLAQYYNTERDCAAIREVAQDPLLNWLALRYLGSQPHFLGCNLWWTYPIRPSREDQIKHAHFFHRDVDDFRFVKYFFYITPVAAGDGGHWLVRGSHRRAPNIRFKDRFRLRRYEDSEIAGFYPADDILEVVGPAGTGFAEDTLCVHKAASPSIAPRLILQLQYGLFDLGVGNDTRPPSELRMIQDRQGRMTSA